MSLLLRPLRGRSSISLAAGLLISGLMFSPLSVYAGANHAAPVVPQTPELVESATEEIPDSGVVEPQLDMPPLSPLEQQVDPRKLMSLMRQASAELNYEASFVHVDNGHIEPIRYTHAVIDGQEVAHLTHLTEPVREMVLRGDSVTHFEPNLEPFTVQGRHMPGVYFQLFNTDLDRLEQNYQMLMAGRSRMAGRPAQVMRLVPNDEHRYGYVLWLDMDTQMLLRADMISREGELIQQVMVVSLYFYNQPSPWLVELSQVALPPVIELPLFDPDNSPLHWGAGWLPKGFVLENADRHRLGMVHKPVDYLQFSDGLIKISVYVSQAGQNSAIAEQRIRQGAVSLHSIIRDNLEITVIGEVPPETTQRVAESVFPVLAKGPMTQPHGAVETEVPAEESSQ